MPGSGGAGTGTSGAQRRGLRVSAGPGRRVQVLLLGGRLDKLGPVVGRQTQQLLHYLGDGGGGGEVSGEIMCYYLDNQETLTLAYQPALIYHPLFPLTCHPRRHQNTENKQSNVMAHSLTSNQAITCISVYHEPLVK